MFFFFKQKTAYEMRISDWSSDVCSSDLCGNSWREGQAGTAGYKSMTRIGSPRESRDPSSIAHGRRHYLRVSDVATSATRAASGSRGMTSYVYGSELDIIVCASGAGVAGTSRHDRNSKSLISSPYSPTSMT